MRFHHLLIILGGIVGCFFVYNDYTGKERDRRNTYSDQVRKVIADAVKSGTVSETDDYTRPTDAPLYQVLALMRQAEQDGYSASDTATQAASGSGARSGAAKIIAERINDNYAIAKALDVFEDLSNMLRMGNGLPPTAHAKGWEDQQLTVGHILSPIFAPEAAKSLANLVLMPEIARDMQSDELGGFNFEQSKRWLTEGIIAPESHQAILAILARKSKRTF